MNRIRTTIFKSAVSSIMIAILATIVILNLPLTVSAETYQRRYGDYTFTVNNNEATIIDFNNSGVGEIRIEQYISGYPIAAIASNAFSGKNNGGWLGHETLFIVPYASLRIIGSYAFSGCSHLRTITIGRGSKLQSIEYGAFANCTSLTDVFFEGTREEWEKIKIAGNNDPLKNAALHISDEEQTSDHSVEREVKVTKISLSMPSVAFGVAAGQVDSVQLLLTIEPANATNKSVTWSSSDENIASVDSDGTIHARKGGLVTIYAAAQDGSGTVGSVTFPVGGVVQLETISLPETLALNAGTSYTIAVTYTPSDATDRQVEWFSSNPGVASVDADGKVTALAEGVSRIEARAKGYAGVNAVCMLTVTGGLLDSDGDGLYDHWENYGIDADRDGIIDVHLEQMGAVPDKKDVFVEVDYMEGLAPDSEAMKMVYDSFQKHGINLHIDCGKDSIDYVTGKTWGDFSRSNSISYQNYVDLYSNNHENWFSLIDSNMDLKRLSSFHYCLYINFFDNDFTSGVTMGGTPFFVVSNMNGALRDSPTKEGGTFMHELGHTLGLLDGGSDSLLYKPNYLSVMNYSFQFTGLQPSGELDYSECALPELNEKELYEATGIDPGRVTALLGYGTKWYPDSLWNSIVRNMAGAAAVKGQYESTIAGKAIDYNENGVIDTYAVSTDLNKDGELTNLTSQNDWDHLVFNLGYIGNTTFNGASGYVSNTADSTAETQELSLKEAVKRGVFNTENRTYVLTEPSTGEVRTTSSEEEMLTLLQDGWYAVGSESGDASSSNISNDKSNHWETIDGKMYWYENGIRQGTITDAKGVRWANDPVDAIPRGREIFDPSSNAWYWLDSVNNGAKATGKEVFMPYVYSNEGVMSAAEVLENAGNSDAGMRDYIADLMKNHTGKWVRYDGDGKMLKGWIKIEGALVGIYPDQAGNTYYYDTKTGAMAKGWLTIDGKHCHFDENSGKLLNVGA